MTLNASPNRLPKQAPQILPKSLCPPQITLNAPFFRRPNRDNICLATGHFLAELQKTQNNVQ